MGANLATGLRGKLETNVLICHRGFISLYVYVCVNAVIRTVMLSFFNFWNMKDAVKSIGSSSFVVPLWPSSLNKFLFDITS